MCLLAVYDKEHSPANGGRIAYCNKFVDIIHPHHTASAICVSDEAIRNSDQATLQMILLHELCHALYQAHNPADEADHGDYFHDHLDSLIAIYNDSTGAQLQNDYNQYSGIYSN